MSADEAAARTCCLASDARVADGQEGDRRDRIPGSGHTTQPQRHPDRRTVDHGPAATPAVLPLLDEIVANQERHAQIIGVGPGVARPGTFCRSVSTLGLPTGAAGDAGRQIFRPERLHGVLPAGEPRFLCIWRRRSSCNCCRPCWRRARGGGCSTEFPPTIFGNTRRPSASLPPHGSDGGVISGGRGVRRPRHHPVEGRGWPLQRPIPRSIPDARFIAEIARRRSHRDEARKPCRSSPSCWNC